MHSSRTCTAVNTALEHPSERAHASVGLQAKVHDFYSSYLLTAMQADCKGLGVGSRWSGSRVHTGEPGRHDSVG